MNDFMFWFGLIANIITVIAGLIAIAGVAWAIAGRASLAFSVSVWPSLTPSLNIVATSSGSSAVRNATISYGAVDDNGFAMWGSGDPVSNPLNRGESLLLLAYEGGTTHFGSPARVDEFRVPLQRGDGMFVTVQWLSPLFPWRNESVTYAWPPRLRFAGAEPERLTGRKELRFLERTRDPKLNPLAGGPPPKAYSQEATDATFDELVRAHQGVVVVGLAPSWQSEHWEDVQRMLEAFAAKHSPKVKVLTVTSDMNPRLNDQYVGDVVPHFVVLRGGQVVAEMDGASSMADLESHFGKHLT